MIRYTIIISTILLAVGVTNAAPLKLTDTQMDTVTAGDLGLPSGNVVFVGFDNPAPGEFHPNFDRSPRALEATTGHGPSVEGMGNEGPWSAGVASPAIECIGC